MKNYDENVFVREISHSVELSDFETEKMKMKAT